MGGGADRRVPDLAEDYPDVFAWTMPRSMWSKTFICTDVGAHVPDGLGAVDAVGSGMPSLVAGGGGAEHVDGRTHRSSSWLSSTQHV